MWAEIGMYAFTSVLSWGSKPKVTVTRTGGAPGPATTTWNGVPDDARPFGIKDFKVPIAVDGKEIPVLFGTREITQPNVVWYGDFKTSPITETRTETGFVTSTFEEEVIKTKTKSRSL